MIPLHSSNWSQNFLPRVSPGSSRVFEVVMALSPARHNPTVAQFSQRPPPPCRRFYDPNARHNNIVFDCVIGRVFGNPGRQDQKCADHFYTTPSESCSFTKENLNL